MKYVHKVDGVPDDMAGICNAGGGTSQYEYDVIEGVVRDAPSTFDCIAVALDGRRLNIYRHVFAGSVYIVEVA